MEQGPKRNWNDELVWEVEITDECREWYEAFDLDTRDRLGDAIQTLAFTGPTMGRPTVGHIVNGGVPGLSELRVGSMRILFTFSPRSVVILLWGADKSEHGWKNWYAKEGIPMAQRLYAEYLAELADEGWEAGG